MQAISRRHMRQSVHIAPSGSHIVQIRLMCPAVYMKCGKLHAQRSYTRCAAQPLCESEIYDVQGHLTQA